MLPFRYVAVFALLALAAAQDYEYQSQGRPAPARIQPGFSGPAQAKPTPVPILKQINRHNEDGSYTYGYEGADGSFKIETKQSTGEVKGKYGYVDDTGKVRVVEYGATKYGFEPSGEGITVAPPTLVDETTNKDGLLQEDFSQYEPQPQQPRARAPAPRPRPSQSFETSYEPAPQYNPAPQQFAPRPAPRPAPTRSFAPAPAPAPRQPSFGFANPAPIQEDTYEEPAPRPAPKVTYAQPRPQPQQQFSFAPPASTQAIARPQPPPQQHQFQPQPQPQQHQFQQQPQQSFAPRPQAQPNRAGGGVLDQLAKDYALPQGGAAPLHDISFGYY